MRGLRGSRIVTRGWCEVGESGKEIREALPLRTVEREVAARDDDLVVAGVDEAIGLVEDRREVLGTRFAAELGDDAEGTLAGATVLDLEVGAGGAERESGLRFGV